MLDDPLYIGWRHERIGGTEYDDFVDAFVTAVQRKFPNCVLQWEDFAQANATRLLNAYRHHICRFNDDIQGTAAVTLGATQAALQVVGARLAEQRIIIAGAGSAGCGIASSVSGHCAMRV